jgi:hypothetical protein
MKQGSTEEEKKIARAWSAVVSSGREGTAEEVFERLHGRPGTVDECVALAVLMSAMRGRGVLP